MLWINATPGYGLGSLLTGCLVTWAGLAPFHRLLVASLAAVVLARFLALAFGASWTSPPAIIARALVLVFLVAVVGIVLSGNGRAVAWHAVFVASPPVMATVFAMTLALALPSFLVADLIRTAVAVAPSPWRRRAPASGAAGPRTSGLTRLERGMEEAYLTRKLVERTGDPAAAERRIAHELAENGAPDRKTAIRHALYRLDDEERQAKLPPANTPGDRSEPAQDLRPAQDRQKPTSGGRDNSRQFRDLRAKVMSDETAERLVAYEIRRRPGIDRKAAIAAAIERLEWERSRD